jgi:hypothetical protein
MLQEFRYALRMLLRTPAFTGIAVLVLALGIGANTAVFTLVNALLLEPLPGEAHGELVGVYGRSTEQAQWRAFSYPNYVDLRARSDAFSGLLAMDFAMVGLTEGTETRRIFASLVAFGEITEMRDFELHRRAEDARDRHPHGARRRATGRALDGAARRAGRDGGGPGDRGRALGRHRDHAHELALPCERRRSDHVHSGSAGPDHGSPRRLLAARSSSDARRPGAGPQGGVSLNGVSSLSGTAASAPNRGVGAYRA